MREPSTSIIWILTPDSIKVFSATTSRRRPSILAVPAGRRGLREIPVFPMRGCCVGELGSEVAARLMSRFVKGNFWKVWR